MGSTQDKKEILTLVYAVGLSGLVVSLWNQQQWHSQSLSAWIRLQMPPHPAQDLGRALGHSLACYIPNGKRAIAGQSTVSMEELLKKKNTKKKKRKKLKIKGTEYFPFRHKNQPYKSWPAIAGMYNKFFLFKERRNSRGRDKWEGIKDHKKEPILMHHYNLWAFSPWQENLQSI